MNDRHMALSSTAYAQCDAAGVLGLFVKNILNYRPRNNDGLQVSWMLLPELTHAPPDQGVTEERRRAKALAVAAWRLLVKALRKRNGDHAALLNNAVEHNILHKSLYGRAAPGCANGPVGAVLEDLRVQPRYNDSPLLSQLIDTAYWISNHTDSFNSRYPELEHYRATEYVGQFFSLWIALVGPSGYEDARAALLTAIGGSP